MIRLTRAPVKTGGDSSGRLGTLLMQQLEIQEQILAAQHCNISLQRSIIGSLDANSPGADFPGFAAPDTEAKQERSFIASLDAKPPGADFPGSAAPDPEAMQDIPEPPNNTDSQSDMPCRSRTTRRTTWESLTDKVLRGSTGSGMEAASNFAMMSPGDLRAYLQTQVDVRLLFLTLFQSALFQTLLEMDEAPKTGLDMAISILVACASFFALVTMGYMIDLAMVLPMVNDRHIREWYLDMRYSINFLLAATTACVPFVIMAIVLAFIRIQLEYGAKPAVFSMEIRLAITLAFGALLICFVVGTQPKLCAITASVVKFGAKIEGLGLLVRPGSLALAEQTHSDLARSRADRQESLQRPNGSMCDDAPEKQVSGQTTFEPCISQCAKQSRHEL